MDTLNVSHNKRLLFIGKTRSGKSYLSRYFLKLFSRDTTRQIIIIDPKHELRQFGDGTSLDYPKLVKKYDDKIRFQVFQTFKWIPELDDMVDKLLKRGNAIVLFDELGGLCDANNVPMGITRLWTQGGGKGVGAWALIQVPRRVPLVIKSQSELFFMFRINSLEHRKAILDFLPDIRVVKEVLPNRYFWVYEEGMDRAIKCKPIKTRQ